MEVPSKLPSRRLSVAPTKDWTDRHCRVFHRHITRHTWLYTEMVTTGALVYGDVERHLRYDEVSIRSPSSWAAASRPTSYVFSYAC